MKNHYLDNPNIWPVIGCINYRGNQVWKIETGFKVLGKEVTTGNQVDEIINQSLSYLRKSIKKMGYDL